MLCGDEPALILSYRRQLAAQLAEKGAEPAVYDAAATDWEQLAQDAQTVGFFGERRLFVINSLAMSELSEQALSILCDLLLKNENANDFLLSTSGEFDVKNNAKAKKLVKTVDGVGNTLLFTQKTAQDARTEAQNICYTLGCDLPAKAATLLIERCGTDLARLHNECRKLCLYAGQGNEITEEMVRTVASLYPDGNIYAVSKHIIKKDAAAALTEVDRLLSLREPVPMILYNLGIAFTLLFSASCAKAAGMDDKTAAKQLGERFLWRMTNAFQDAAKYDGRLLLDCCRKIRDAETKLKSQTVNERVLLEQLVISLICSLGGQPL